MESERRPDERPTEVVAANEAHERINLLIDRLTALTTERDAWRKQASADGARCQKLHAEVADLREALNDAREMRRATTADLAPREDLEEVKAQLAATAEARDRQTLRAEGAERAVRAARMQRDTYSVRTRELDEIAGDDARKIDRLTREHDELRKQVSALTDELERSAGTARINELRHELIAEDRKFTALEELHRTTQAERDEARNECSRLNRELVDRAERLKAEYDTERQRNVADRVARSAYETACNERDEEREHRIANEQWALREQARAYHYGRLYGQARVAWQLVVDARNGLAALLAHIDATDETFDSDINADQEG